jgi:hypothetical protein
MNIRIKVGCCLTVAMLAPLPVAHAAGPEQKCTIIAAREIVMSETRGGPQPAIDDGAAPAAKSASRHNVTIDCSGERLNGVFASTENFDANRYRVGVAVTVILEKSALRLRLADGREAKGILVPPNMSTTPPPSR